VQIRIGNKQDEASVRLLVGEVLAESGKSLDIEAADRDLRSIEINYFGHDGVFLVAEEERKIVGIAAALKRTETTCEVKRLYVTREHRGKGVGTQLLQQLVRFARNLDYDQLVVSEDAVDQNGSHFLSARGFLEGDAGLSLKLAQP